MPPQTDHSPLSPLPRSRSLSPISLLAGMQGPLCQKAQARQEAGRHRWFSEEIPELQKAFPPQAQQSWGLLLVKTPLLVWAAAQTVRRLGEARGRRAAGCACGREDRPALLAPASSFPGFLTLFSTATQRRLGKALFTTQQIKPQGEGEG